MAKVRYVRSIDALDKLTDTERRDLAAVAEKYAFRANDYYLGLIDWSDPADPIRRLVVPSQPELTEFGDLDPSGEESNYAAPGVQHKYPHTALLLVTEVCGAYCRFCFRKRLFMDGNDEAAIDVRPGIQYIRDTEEISNVLLTGGDPLILSTRRLEQIIRPLRSISHVKIIRIGSKMPAFNPYRILNDPDLTELISRYSSGDQRIYIMTHFNHPRELTEPACRAIEQLQKAGAILANQTPILRGVNDRAETLAELMRKLSYLGVPPYYFFQCRPTEGNKPFAVPIVEAYRALEAAKRKVSGLEKRARLVMSHKWGKIEVVGLTRGQIFLKYHRARRPEDEGRFMILARDDQAYWLDDLVHADGTPGSQRPKLRAPSQPIQLD